MRTIIAGSRNFQMEGVLSPMLASFDQWEITEVVSGHGGNVDLAGELWAAKNKIPVKLFPAPWKLLGPKAGPFRNCKMAEYAEALIAFWDGKSRGTANMLKEAQKHNLLVYIAKV